MARFLVRITAAALLIGAGSAFAQTPRINLGELEPALQSEVRARLAGGRQTEREIVSTLLLNNLQLRYPAQRLTSFDWAASTVTYVTPAGESRTLPFEKRTLSVK